MHKHTYTQKCVWGAAVVVVAAGIAAYTVIALSGRALLVGTISKCPQLSAAA